MGGENIEFGRDSEPADGKAAGRHASSSSRHAVNSARTEQGTDQRWSAASSALLLDGRGHVSPSESPRGDYRHPSRKAVDTSTNHKLSESEGYCGPNADMQVAEWPKQRTRPSCDDGLHVQRMSFIDEDLSNLLPDLPP